jgi:hypothetical protein
MDIKLFRSDRPICINYAFISSIQHYPELEGKVKYIIVSILMIASAILGSMCERRS